MISDEASDSDADELFDRLSDAADETEDPAGNVKEAFDNFQNQTGKQATGGESSRTDRIAN